MNAIPAPYWQLAWTSGRRRGVEDGLELIQHPVELLLGDDQRRCESNRDVVGLLRQHAKLREALGGLPARQYRRIEVHPGPQPDGANVGDPPAAFQGLQPAPEPLPQDAGAFLELPGLQEAYHCMTNRDRQRIAAEGRPVAARSDDTRTSFRDRTADTGTIPPPSALPNM
jgi:hypothetical protein